MTRFERSPPCRLCKCPVAGTGVCVADLDLWKLSLWWLEVLKTELDEDEPEKKFFCQFCLWDSKFQSEKNKSGACNPRYDWWTGWDSNEFYKKFYFEADIIRPCEVRIAPLSLPDKKAPDENLAFTKVLWSRGKRIRAHCVFCGKVFESKNSAYWHVTEVHKEEAKFFCFNCRVHFRSKKEKIIHFTAFPHNRVRCHFCPKSLQQTDLKNHITGAHSVLYNQLKCCGIRYNRPNELFQHIVKTRKKKKHLEKTCIYCKKSFRDLRHHVQSHHASVAIKCSWKYCVTYFLSRDEEQRHTEQVHGQKIRIKCVYCSVEFPKETLRIHTMLEHKSEAIRCNFSQNCRTFFLSEQQRRQHILKCHFTSAPKKDAKCPKCSICSRTFHQRCNLYRHLRETHKKLVYPCKVRGCSEYFSREDDLKTHSIEVHRLKEKKFRCAECDFRTHEKCILKRHIMLKHGFDKLKCPKCGKVFESKYALRKHKFYTHLKPKTCIHCKISVKELTTHLRVPPCAWCNKTVACRGMVKRHQHRCSGNE